MSLDNTSHPEEATPRPGPSLAGAGGEPRVAGGLTCRFRPCAMWRSPGGRRRRLSLGTGSLGVLTAFSVRAKQTTSCV